MNTKIELSSNVKETFNFNSFSELSKHLKGKKMKVVLSNGLFIQVTRTAIANMAKIARGNHLNAYRFFGTAEVYSHTVYITFS